MRFPLWSSTSCWAGCVIVAQSCQWSESLLGETWSDSHAEYFITVMFILWCGTTSPTGLQAGNNNRRCRLIWTKNKNPLSKFQWVSKNPETLNLSPQLSYTLMFLGASRISSVCTKSCLRISWFPDSLRKPNNLICRAAFLHKVTVQWSRSSPSPMAAQSTIRRRRTKPLLFLQDVLCQDEICAFLRGTWFSFLTFCWEKVLKLRDVTQCN